MSSHAAEAPVRLGVIEPPLENLLEVTLPQHDLEADGIDELVCEADVPDDEVDR